MEQHFLIDQLKEKIQNKISDLNYNTWFRPAAKGVVSNGVFTFTVPNKFVADWISDYYGDLVRQALFDLTGEPLQLSFEIASDQEDAVPAPFEAPQKTRTISTLAMLGWSAIRIRCKQRSKATRISTMRK